MSPAPALRGAQVWEVATPARIVRAQIVPDRIILTRIFSCHRFG
jgi:hypothetical protein